MNRLVVTLLLGLSSGLVAWSGVNTSPSYVNNGIVNAVTGVPQIDATSFINNGSFSVFTSIPYDTLNTLTFTNTGLISGSNFRFDHVFHALYFSTTFW